MLQPISIQCPYCFELVTIYLAYDDIGEMVHDCDVCCRPWNLRVWLDEDGVLRASAGR